MPPEDRLALRDILALASSMTRIDGQNPGLCSATHIFWFYPDRIVRCELGGGPVLPIEYGNDEYGTLSTVLNASGSTTGSFSELLNDGRLQQVMALLSELQERRRLNELENASGDRNLRLVRVRSKNMQMEMEDQMPRIDKRPDLQELINQFVATIGYDHSPGYQPLVVSEPYYPYDDPDGKLPWPHPDEPGCYVWTNGDGRILDIGKASRYMGNRIFSARGRKRKPGEVEVFPDAEPFVKDNQPDIAVWTIPVPDTDWYLAPALEGFLYDRVWGKRT